MGPFSPKKTTPPTTVPALLRAARGELDRRGWTRHDLVAPTGEVCLLGALNAPLTEDVRDEPATVDAQWLLVAAVDTLVRRLPPTDRADAEEDCEYPEDLAFYLFGEISNWNAADGRTLAQVVALLDTTAAELEDTDETVRTAGIPARLTSATCPHSWFSDEVPPAPDRPGRAAVCTGGCPPRQAS
ncbi:DUF6197 family protein [Candidatus Frankia alpina]|uniref:DUF6197 family protein n=1 Tax=Candidatus Frankia alpina TaxID=2699483 RepID=UPI0013D03CAB|nr:hypothetical protein [Candidatus Frankia alpina]